MRNHKDWLQAYLQYTQYSEAPRYMHFWTGVSTIAACLRRKVWIDEVFFRWYPSFYIIFVAEPGKVSKSTTSNIGYQLLKDIEGIHLGPNIITWQSLVQIYAAATETFEHEGKLELMSAISFNASELGNLLDPKDKKLVDLLIKLYDCEDIKKETKHVGTDNAENPWINIIACTTPSWATDNFTKNMLGGGLFSRTLFVYADKKRQHIAYPSRQVKEDLSKLRRSLTEDLQQISEVSGQFTLSEEAYEWGTNWYEAHSNSLNEKSMDKYGGYFSRKQSHIHKLAMVLSVSQSSKLIIEKEHLQVAETMITDLEPDMMKVFDGIGKKSTTEYAEKLLHYLAARGSVPYQQAYQFVHAHFPALSNYENMLAGLVTAGYIKLERKSGIDYLTYVRK